MGNLGSSVPGLKIQDLFPVLVRLRLKSLPVCLIRAPERKSTNVMKPANNPTMQCVTYGHHITLQFCF